MKKNTLLSRYDSKNNSFTLLSTILALLIIYYHCYFLFYGPNTQKFDIITRLFSTENAGSIIVAMFFVISGFLITSSIKRSRSIYEYIKKRVFRIFPALLLVLLVTTFIIAPLILPLTIKEYLSNPSIWYRYIIDNILLYKNTIYSISNSFANNPYPYAINGSLWTIKHQFFTYLYIIPIYMIFIKKDKKDKFKYYMLFILIITMLSFSGYYDAIISKVAFKLGYIGILNEGSMFIRLVYYFSIGIFFNVYSDKISYKKENLITALAILILTAKSPLFSYFSLFLIPYFTIYLGTLKCKIKFLDISYYIYLLGFPIQQLIIFYLNGKINIYMYILISLLLSMFFSLLMYFIIKYIPKLIKNFISRRELKNEV